MKMVAVFKNLLPKIYGVNTHSNTIMLNNLYTMLSSTKVFEVPPPKSEMNEPTFPNLHIT